MQRCREFPDFEIFQYVFSQKILCALRVLLLRSLMTITHAISGLGEVVEYALRLCPHELNTHSGAAGKNVTICVKHGKAIR